MKALPRVGLLVLLPLFGAVTTPVFGQNGTWSATSTGTYNWSSTANWSGGTVASGAGAVATIPSQVSTSTGVTITLDTPETVGGVAISGKYGGYTISGTNSLTLNNNGAGATLSLASGATNATVAVPLVLADNLTLANASTANFTLSGNISGTGNIIINSTNSKTTGITGASINNAGTITNSGSGSGGASIALGAVGSAVTGLIENSSTSGMSLSGTASAFTGTINVANGTLGMATVSASNSVLNVGSTGTVSTTNSALTIGGLTGSTGATLNNSSSNKLLSIAGTGTYTYAGAITGVMQVSVTGGGTEILSGTSSSTGALGVSNAGSTLIVNGSIAAPTVSVFTNGTLGGTGSIAGNVALTAAGTISLVDGTVGTLTVGGLSTGASGSNATSITFELGAGGTGDAISTGNLTVNTANGTKIFIDNLGNASSQGIVNGNYNLIAYSGTLSGVLADLSLQTTSLDGHALSLTSLGNGDLVLNVSGGSVNSYYFTGSNSGSFTDAGNYYTLSSTGTQQAAALSSTSDVYLNATSPTPKNTPDTLNTSATVNSLSIVSSGSSLAGTGTLTLQGTSDGTVTNGLADSATGGTTESVSPTIALGASQGWTVSSASNTLAVTGGVTGTSGQTLTLNGAGSFNFSGASSGAFNTTVSSGGLVLSNGVTGSALGTGTLTVARGASFGGAGQALNMAAFAIGSGGTGTTQVQVGAGGTSTNTNLTLTATGASTIANANLTFNLSSTTLGQSNELVLGSTAITLSNTTLTLNITGSNIITSGTTYLLMTDSAGFAGLNVAQGTNGVITSGLTIAPNAFFGAENGSGQTTGFYSNSILFVTDGGTEIEVEVVPEPGTWAMMLGGLTMLVLWQRRKSKSGLVI